MFTGLGEFYCICEKSSVQLLMAAEEAGCNLRKIASSDVTQWLSRIVGNVGPGF